MAKEDDFRGEGPACRARAPWAARETPRQPRGSSLSYTCHESARLPSVGDDAALIPSVRGYRRRGVSLTTAPTSGLAG